jgi:hypothetical protein
MGGPLSPNSPPRVRQRRRPQRRRLGRRGRPLPPFLPSAVFDPCTFRAAFNATDTLHPGQHSARLGQARDTCERRGEGGQDTALPERRRGLTAESPGQAPSASAQAPNVSKPAAVAQTQRIRKRTLGVAAHARTRRLPQPCLPSLRWDERGLDLLGIQPVGVRGFEHVPRRVSPSLSPPAPALLETSCALPSRRWLGKRGHRRAVASPRRAARAVQ